MTELSQHPEAVGEIFNLGSDHEITIMELARMVKRITGSDSEIVTVPYGDAYEKGFEDMARRVPDLSKIKALIGYEPTVNLDETIRQIWAFYQSERPQAFLP